MLENQPLSKEDLNYDYDLENLSKSVELFIKRSLTKVSEYYDSILKVIHSEKENKLKELLHEF